MRHSVEGMAQRRALLQRLRWRSRRGMLELELALRPFVDGCLETLDDADLGRYEILLAHDDWDIFDWVQGRDEPEDRTLTDLVRAIRAANTP